ncbi:MAG TPA: S9 family peptidase [Bryobacteraceae bacterium]|nr:S9 family peptidase [Bryobacteraceae bacterium]
MRTARISVVAALIACAAFAAAQAPLAFDQVYDSLSATAGINETAISPDGAYVAWVQNGIQIAKLEASGASAPRRLAVGHGVEWAPDSRRVAFLAEDGAAGQLQLYVTAIDSGTPKKVTSLTGYLAAPRWSSDGNSVAFLFTENAPRAAGPLQPSTPESGVVGSHIYNQRIAVADLASGAVRQISPPDLYVHEYDWSPDGRAFAATAGPGPGDNNWYISKLYTFAASGQKAAAIYQPPLQIADPRWSPDGGSIAFVGGLMSDEGMTGGDVFLISASGGAARNLTPGMKASASGVYWLAGGRLLVPQLVDGDSAFATLDVSTGAMETVWRGPGAASRNGWLPGASLSRDGKLSALVRHSFEAPPEVWAGPLGAWRKISDVNSKLRAEWGQSRSLHWTTEGRSVQGWLLYPRNYDPAKRWPMVVWVHGGPAGMEGSHWPAASMPGLLAAAGYFVLFPNPRGSLGSGEAFTQANVRDFGYGDLRDILGGVDEAIKTLPIDNDRVGITGWSYGGYMSMWSVTQTSRFRASVAGAGLANWQSYYGQNLIDQWLLPYFGASVYDDPAVYARSSPITFIKNVKTPTLILVGDRDAECPAPQSWEFWHALKTLGVTTEFVIYPGEGHAIGQPAHQRDIVRRALAWFDKYL